MDEKLFVIVANQLIKEYIGKEGIAEDYDSRETYTVWLSKVLQNNKGLFSTPLEDGRYYEVTYNGDKEEYYVDVYKEEANIKYNEEDL